MKPRIGLDYQIFKEIFFGLKDHRIKLDVSDKRLSRDISWILGLIKSREFEGYITTGTFKKMVEMIKEEVGSDQEREFAASNLLSLYSIKVYSIQDSPSSRSSLSGEVGEYISLLLELDLDIFITKSPEMLDRFILDNHLFNSKLKAWILTPIKFTKLVSIQNKHINRSTGWKYSFRDISSLKEIEVLHQFETEILPSDTALSENKLKDWWQTYQAGIKAIFMGREIMGILSLWPLSEITVQKLREAVRNGVFSESQLNVLPYEDGKRCKHWYIGGFYLHEDLRSKGLSEGFVDDLLLRSLTFWCAGGEKALKPSLEEGVEILAVPVNPYAESILKKYGFHQEQGTTHDGFPLYVKSVHSAHDLLSSF